MGYNPAKLDSFQYLPEGCSVQFPRGDTENSALVFRVLEGQLSALTKLFLEVLPPCRVTKTRK
jgi:hypothetical protein